MEILIYSTLAGLATSLGAVIVVIYGRPKPRILSGMLGFASGIMLAIAAMELLPAALSMGTVFLTAGGFVLGAALMAVLDVALPHVHLGACKVEEDFTPSNGIMPDPQLMKLGWFIAIGIGLHNIPEGLAIGAGYLNSPAMGLAIVVGLAFHNIPEGMATACPLLLGGMTPWRIVLLTLLVGMMTPLGTLIGAFLFSAGEAFVAMAMAFAAGAMIYIVSDELIPQSHKYHSHTANAGLLLGFLIVLILG
jgi:ZIP family zinc transporter